MSTTLAPPAESLAEHGDEARRLMRTGLIVIVGAVLPVGAWMSFAPLSSAVVAPAFVKVDLNRRPVQHAEGGLVRQVLVRDGQHVKAGQPLLVLGDVAVDADQNRLNYRVAVERAAQARLEAERAMAPTLVFPPEVLAGAAADQRVAEQVAKEQALFQSRRNGLVGQVALLRTQRTKVDQEIVALRSQVAQAIESQQFQKEELENSRRLMKEGFLSQARVSQLAGGVSDYGVKLEERRSELARAEQRLVDTDLRIRAMESDYQQQASDQLKVTSARVSEIEQEQRKSSDAFARQTLFAPVSGRVLDLKYNSPGAIIAPREPIADIVPDESKLVTEAHIRPEDVNRVHAGQQADVRFTAFNYSTTQLVRGTVSYISADRLIDRASGMPYYQVHVEASTEAMKTLGDLKLQAGMPAEVYIVGEKRTPLQYLMEPVTQVLRRAARER
ncbi:MAG: type secretion rane fusion protein HlyD family [Ramlibacter sp.]|jgi:epimerase transport system membrane fusion protein|uniref:HlyD family type I secretion periplasmic adaptor subunit n=1 Tax=Ramlibacter sp. TaxID=1917967 RepID=UPI00261CB81F|nr:HlyD family type I secretion periplasmic adaptor subunit [Ramlibacter sp.]MDB5751720.1 type secretion rane fusion protein HlyD family [Ramlibacter sp.]